MPYKDASKRRENDKRYYLKNRDKIRKINKEACKKRYLKIKAWYDDYKKSLSCEKCGEGEAVCLDFHHRDPNKKDFNIRVAVNRRYSIDRILEEISKCIILCSNCHRKLHANLIKE